MKHRYSRAFALPMVMITSVVMMMVLVSGLAAASSISVGINSQYETKLMRTAASSGLEMAKSCIESNDNTVTWTNTEPLKPNTDCTGAEMRECSTTSTANSCYVLNGSNYRSTFSVTVNVDASGKPSSISSKGTLMKIRSSSGSVATTTSSSMRAAVQDVSFSTINSGLSAGGNHVCGITYYNKAFCWGANTYGKLGNGGSTSSASPTPVSAGSIPGTVTIKMIEAGSQHTCALGSNGRVYCWGYNGSGRLGNGTTADSSTPVAVSQGAIPAGQDIIDISVGDDYSCAVAANGQAYCWGGNSFGQLGNGTTATSTTPVAVSQGAVPASVTFRNMASGGANSCALGSDGKGYCWGYNYYGQLGNGGTANASAPVAVSQGAMPSDVVFRSIDAVSAGACGTGSNGKAYCWGNNSYGKLGNGTSLDSSVPVAVSQGAIPAGESLYIVKSGGSASCGIASNGKAYCWGYNGNNVLGNGTSLDSSVPVAVSQGAIPAGVSMKSIVIAGNYACAIGTDTNAYCWGANNNGQLGDGTTANRTTPVLALGGSSALVQGETQNISNSTTHTCAIGRDGNAACWGQNTSGQLGNGSTTNSSTPVAVSQGAVPAGVKMRSLDVGTYSTCAIAGNNKVYCWGSDTNGALGNGASGSTAVAGALSLGATPVNAIIKSISMGSDNGCITTSEEKVYCWGNGIYGQLGNGTSGGVSQTPVAVSQGAIPAGVTLKSVSAGGQVVCALGSDGKAYCWGSGGYGKLGNGSTANSSTPVAVSQGAVPAGVTFTSIDAGDYNSVCALGSDGKAYCWGYNSFGGLGNGTTTDSSTPVAVSQGAVPAGVTFTSVASGGASTCALGSDGKAYCWGNGTSGQLGNGTFGQATTPVAVSQGAIPVGVSIKSISFGFSKDVCVIGSDKVPYCWGDNYYGQLGNGTTTDVNSPTTILQRISWRGGVSMSGPAADVKFLVF